MRLMIFVLQGSVAKRLHPESRERKAETDERF